MNTRKMVQTLLSVILLIAGLAPSYSLAQSSPVVVSVLKWSPDGTRLAGGYSDGSVKIWNPITHEIELTLEGHTQQVDDIAWSPDGEKLIAGGFDETAYIWNTSSGLAVGTLTNFGHSIFSISWTTSNYIVTHELQSNEGLRIWSATTYELLERQNAGNIEDIVQSPNELYLGLGNAAGSLIVKDSSTFDTVIAFRTGSASSIDWSTDNNRLVLGGVFGGIELWDWTIVQILFSSQSSNSLDNTDPIVKAITFSSDGQRVASTALDGTIRVWDWATEQLLTDDQLGVRVTAAAWSPDGRWLAYGAEDGSMSVIAAPISLTCAHAVSSGDTNQLVDHIESINASGIADTICLSPTSTQTFTTPDSGLNALPIITGDITIEGNGATLTRDETADLFRFFEIAPGGSLTLNNLTLSHGEVNAQGGAILNNGTLTINDSTLTDNYANHSGGAIYNNGTLTLTNTTLHNNATYRAPDTAAAPLVGCEEAIYTTPTGRLTLIDSACTSPLP